jgi:hypothetical protein
MDVIYLLDTIDYTKPPEPPLVEEYAAWADLLLRSAGKRLH